MNQEEKSHQPSHLKIAATSCVVLGFSNSWLWPRTILSQSTLTPSNAASSVTTRSPSGRRRRKKDTSASSSRPKAPRLTPGYLSLVKVTSGLVEKERRRGMSRIPGECKVVAAWFVWWDDREQLERERTSDQRQELLCNNRLHRAIFYITLRL